MAKVYLSYIRQSLQQDPDGGNNADEMYYRIEDGSTKNNIGSFSLDKHKMEPNILLENDAATKSDPLFFTLWEDDPGSGDDPFETISHLNFGDPGAIKDGGIYFDGTPGYYAFSFSGSNGGVYDLGFTVA